MPGNGENLLSVPSFTSSNDQKYAVLILNNSLNVGNAPYFKKIWINARVRVCVDGGTNCFHNLIYKTLPSINSSSVAFKEDDNIHLTNDIHGAAHTNSVTNGCSPSSPTEAGCQANVKNEEIGSVIPLPDFISGDFDSIDESIKDFYKEKGVAIIPTPNQDETDFTKALHELISLLSIKSEKVEHIVVVSGISHNRFDHVMANINTLHKFHLLSPVPLLMVTESCVLALLSPGAHRISAPPSLSKDSEENWCSYVPFMGPTVVSTQGLKWDVVKAIVQFGGLVSTSNKFLAGQDVFLSTDKPILWMMGYSAK